MKLQVFIRETWSLLLERETPIFIRVEELNESVAFSFTDAIDVVLSEIVQELKA
jgi:hypothetical protein